jgi:hypothetical protein
MASSLFSNSVHSCIVFIFDVMNNFCTHGRYEIFIASSTSSSDTGGCSEVPNTAYFERCEAILPSVHLQYTYIDTAVHLCVTAVPYSKIDPKMLF